LQCSCEAELVYKFALVHEVVTECEESYLGYDEIVLASIEGRSDIARESNYWRLVTVFDDPVELVADRITSIRHDKGIAALTADKGIETLECHALEDIVISAEVIDGLTHEQVVSKAAIKVGGEATRYADLAIVRRGVKDKAYWRLEILEKRIG
jgi:hypothetical protein